MTTTTAKSTKSLLRRARALAPTTMSGAKIVVEEHGVLAGADDAGNIRRTAMANGAFWEAFQEYRRAINA